MADFELETVSIEDAPTPISNKKVADSMRAFENLVRNAPERDDGGEAPDTVKVRVMEDKTPRGMVTSISRAANRIDIPVDTWAVEDFVYIRRK